MFIWCVCLPSARSCLPWLAGCHRGLPFRKHSYGSKLQLFAPRGCLTQGEDGPNQPYVSDPVPSGGSDRCNKLGESNNGQRKLLVRAFPWGICACKQCSSHCTCAAPLIWTWSTDKVIVSCSLVKNLHVGERCRLRNKDIFGKRSTQ